MTAASEDRRHVLFTMLTACAWRDAPAGPAPVVAGLRTFLDGWLGIGRILSGRRAGALHSGSGGRGTGGTAEPPGEGGRKGASAA